MSACGDTSTTALEPVEETPQGQTTEALSPEKILFVGDSITDLKNHAEEPNYRNYVSIVQEHLSSESVTVVSEGVGGNTTLHLLGRWSQDVIAQKPTTVVIMIGINDVDYEYRFENRMDEFAYQANLLQLVQRTKAALPGVKIVLMAPFFVWDSREPLPTGGGYNAEIRDNVIRYQNRMAELAGMLNLPLLEPQRVFNHAMMSYLPSEISADAIHLTDLGNQILAEEVLRYLELERGAK